MSVFHHGYVNTHKQTSIDQSMPSSSSISDMKKYADLKSSVKAIKDSSNPERKRLRSRISECKSQLLDHFDGLDVNKMTVKAHGGVPALVARKENQKKKRKLDTTLACDAWERVMESESKVKQLLGEGQTMQEAACAAYLSEVRDMLDSSALDVPHASVIEKGSKKDTGSESDPSRPAPDDVGKLCAELWKLESGLAMLNKNDRVAIGDMNKEIKDLEVRIKDHLKQVSGSSQELMMNSNDDSSVLMRLKYRRSKGKQDSVLDQVTSMLSSTLTQEVGDDTRVGNHGIPRLDNMRERICDVFKSTGSGSAQGGGVTESLTIEQGPKKGE